MELLADLLLYLVRLSFPKSRGCTASWAALLLCFSFDVASWEELAESLALSSADAHLSSFAIPHSLPLLPLSMPKTSASFSAKDKALEPPTGPYRATAPSRVRSLTLGQEPRLRRSSRAYQATCHRFRPRLAPSSSSDVQRSSPLEPAASSPVRSTSLACTQLPPLRIAWEIGLMGHGRRSTTVLSRLRYVHCSSWMQWGVLTSLPQGYWAQTGAFLSRSFAEAHADSVHTRSSQAAWSSHGVGSRWVFIPTRARTTELGLRGASAALAELVCRADRWPSVAWEPSRLAFAAAFRRSGSGEGVKGLREMRRRFVGACEDHASAQSLLLYRDLGGLRDPFF